MQRNIRKLVIFAGLPLAAIALAVFVLGWGAGSGQKAQAADTTGLNFSLSANGCDSSKLPVKCMVTAGSQFTVAFNVNSRGTAPAYAGYDTVILWSGNVNYINGSIKQQGAGTWENGGANGCGVPATVQSGGVPTPVGTKSVIPTGSMSAGCIQGLGATPSTWDKVSDPAGKGTLLTMGFDCKSGGSGTITLLLGPSTDVVDASLNSYNEAGTSESLTVNCNTPVPATSTPTTPPTPTPPSIPKMQKLPALQNVFLTRQGAKLPPATCAAGTDVAVLNEGINIPINTLSKGVVQHLGGFEFEVRFDSKLVCVSIAAGPLFSGPNAVCQTLTSADKGLVRFSCFTIGKGNAINGPGTLAVISVRPQPELYSQMRPGQSNGIPVQILNQGCQLTDDQGVAIPIFSCEDADITFRFLEGDVIADCVVDAFDAQLVASRWGQTKGNLGFNPFMDLSPTGHGLNGDGRIDVQDLQVVFGRLGSRGTNPKGGNGLCTGTAASAWPPQPPVNPKA